MDLFAYSQIDRFDGTVKKHKIEIPRIRGYRLMAEEKAITSEEIEEVVRDVEMITYEHCVTSVPRFHPDSIMMQFSISTDRLKKKYLIQKTVIEEKPDGETFSYRETVGFRWNLIHGKNRSRLKYAIKKKARAVRKVLETFNKYVGREDVLCVHARIGGGNWSCYGGREIEAQPWFLEKADDFFDDTYCDIYVKIDGEKGGVE